MIHERVCKTHEENVRWANANENKSIPLDSLIIKIMKLSVACFFSRLLVKCVVFFCCVIFECGTMASKRLTCFYTF